MISPDSIVIDSSDLNLDQQNELCARACLLNPVLDRELDTDLEAGKLDKAQYGAARADLEQELLYDLARTGEAPRKARSGRWATLVKGSTWHGPKAQQTRRSWCRPVGTESAGQVPRRAM